ncbi:hypothetical protein HZB88_05510 [archaeon]|nr:hypothetical protein [archaeon]
MLSLLKQIIEGIRDSPEFKQYAEKKIYLASCFSLNNPDAKEGWQIDFYEPEKHKMKTFTMAGSTIRVQDEEEIFQRFEAKIEELNLALVKTDLPEALQKVDALLSSKYTNEKKDKAIIILQAVRSVPVWNITYLTTSFKILNVKLNALTGTILSEKMENIISFKAPYA